MRTTTLALLLATMTGLGTAQATEPLRLDDATLARVTAGARSYLSVASGAANAIAFGSKSSTSTSLDLATRLGGSRSSSSSTAKATIGQVLSVR